MPSRQALLVAVVLGAGPLAVMADAHGESVAHGQMLAQSYCDQCHVIVRDGPAGWTGAPSFAAIADRPTTTAVSLQAFMEKPHMEMLHLARSPSEAARPRGIYSQPKRTISGLSEAQCRM
jgi:hypothetical protein